MYPPQGNVFYSLRPGHGAGGTIRRAAWAPSRSSPDHDGMPKNFAQAEDTLIYAGTGGILAMAVDADDNLLFTMADALAVTGGVYTLEMAPGGVVRSREQLEDEESFGIEGDGQGEDTGNSGGVDVTAAPAALVAPGLGPFLPGVAVCPVTGDVYVTRGHTGIARLVKGADGGFSSKVRCHVMQK